MRDRFEKWWAEETEGEMTATPIAKSYARASWRAALEDRQEAAPKFTEAQLKEHAVQLGAISMAGMNSDLWSTRQKLAAYLEQNCRPGVPSEATLRKENAPKKIPKERGLTLEPELVCSEIYEPAQVHAEEITSAKVADSPPLATADDWNRIDATTGLPAPVPEGVQGKEPQTAHFEGWISDSISGLPLDRSQCNSPNAPTYIHRETENCWGAYVAGEASGRRWKIAIEEACIVNHINFYPEDAQKSLSNLITWETKIALDPKVSKEAADLFASGRRSALTDFEKWAESQRSGLDEEHTGKVIDWCEKLLNP